MNKTITYTGRTFPLGQFVTDSQAFGTEGAERLIILLATRGAITAPELVHACIGVPMEMVAEASYTPPGDAPAT